MAIQAGNNNSGLEITYYTDPLCCWSWGFEPQWRRLLYEYRENIRYRYCMGGLLPTWANYNDAANAVTRPIQLGPVWMHAKEISGMPMDHNIWMRDPPSSSYPACVAVKCASLQSFQAQEMYLRLLREELMINGKNISSRKMLFQIASGLKKNLPGFDVLRFKEDYENDTGLNAFKKDLQEKQYHHINRFPTLVLQNADKKGIVISGYRPYAMLLESIRKIADLQINPTIDKNDYKNYWPSITERELKELRLAD